MLLYDTIVIACTKIISMTLQTTKLDNIHKQCTKLLNINAIHIFEIKNIRIFHFNPLQFSHYRKAKK